MDVTAIVTREGPRYAIEVPEISGLFTQAESEAEIVPMVRDAAALLDHGLVNVTVQMPA